MFKDKKALVVSLFLLVISPIFIFLVVENSPLVILFIGFLVLLGFLRGKKVIFQFVLLIFVITISNFLTKDFSSVLSQRKIAMVGEIETQRGECLKTFSPFVCRLFYNKLENFLGHFFGNIISHFSLNFLFLDASSASDFSYPKKGLFYLWQLPLFFIGLSKMGFKKAGKYLAFIAFSVLISSLFSPGEILAFVFSLPFILYVESFGWPWLFDFFQRKKPFIRNIAYFAWIAVVVLGMISFQISLLAHF